MAIPRDELVKELLESMKKSIDDELGPNASKEEKDKALVSLLNSFGQLMFNLRMG